MKLTNQILQDYCADIEESLKDWIADSVLKAYENTTRKIDLKKMQQAMDKYIEVRENTPYPSEEDSVRHVLAENQLIILTKCLNQKDKKMAEILYSFRKTSILKELCDGAYHKYTQHSGKEDFYFNIPCQYNLKELKLYIDGGDKDDIYGLKRIYEKYVDVMKELSALKQ